jgi:hypothetical protein
MVDLGLRSILDEAFKWLGANARSFSYLLPDSMELALYLILAAYFTAQFVTKQA